MAIRWPLLGALLTLVARPFPKATLVRIVEVAFGGGDPARMNVIEDSDFRALPGGRVVLVTGEPGRAIALLQGTALVAVRTLDGGTVCNSGGEGFDLAPYRIAPGVTAIGWRSCAPWNSYAAGGYDEAVTLHLLVPSNGTLSEVFAAVIARQGEARGEWPKGGGDRPFVPISEQATLQVLHTSTNGHFDLLRRDHDGTKAIFRWREGRYRVRVKDADQAESILGPHPEEWQYEIVPEGR